MPRQKLAKLLHLLHRDKLLAVVLQANGPEQDQEHTKTNTEM
jgi:hypothetical protein